MNIATYLPKLYLPRIVTYLTNYLRSLEHFCATYRLKAITYQQMNLEAIVPFYEDYLQEF